MAHTLASIAPLLPKGSIEQTYVDMFVANAPLLSNMPIEEAPRGRADYTRPVYLGGSSTRRINEGYTSSEAEWENVSFFTKIRGGEIDVDTYLVAMGGPEARARTEEMKAIAIAHQLDYDILNGDESSDNKVFNGIKTLLSGTGQVIENDPSSTGAALSIKKLQEAVLSCVNPTHIAMSRATFLNLDASTRVTGTAGYLTYSRNQLGVMVPMFGGLPILITDPTGHTAPPLTGFSEPNNTTSVYVLNLSGDGRGPRLIQMGDMRISNLGEIDASPVYRTRFEWYVGLALPDPRSVVRLTEITNATAAA